MSVRSPGWSVALIHAHRWARRHDALLRALIEERARHWYATDRDCQAWEPSGKDFLSPALVEAALMIGVLDAGFSAWFDGFLPAAARRRPATLFTPALVSDRTDGTIAHLDGLNLSRAWCWRAIGGASSGRSAAAAAHAAAQAHLDASLAHIADDYMGTHWLATFALLAIDRAVS